MCYVVVDPAGSVVLKIEENWQEAVRVCNECGGRIHTEGGFSNE